METTHVDLNQEDLDAAIENDRVVGSIRRKMAKWKESVAHERATLKAEQAEINNLISYQRRIITGANNEIRALEYRAARLKSSFRVNEKQFNEYQRQLAARIRLVRDRVSAAAAKKALQAAMKRLTVRPWGLEAAKPPPKIAPTIEEAARLFAEQKKE